MAAYYPPPQGVKAFGLPPQKSGSQSTLAIMNHKVSQFSSNSKNRDIPIKDPNRTSRKADTKMRYSTGMLPALADNMRQTSTLDPYPGALPTLGLNKYKNVDFKQDEKYPNPYRVQRHQSTTRDGNAIKNSYVYRAVHSKEEIFDERMIQIPGDQIHSEKLLLQNERERKFKDIEKLEREGLKIWQKEKNTIPNRAGAVQAVKNIPRHKAVKVKTGLQSAPTDEEGQQTKGKINIFDAPDQVKLLGSLQMINTGGADDSRALVPVRTQGSRS